QRSHPKYAANIEDSLVFCVARGDSRHQTRSARPQPIFRLAKVITAPPRARQSRKDRLLLDYQQNATSIAKCITDLNRPGYTSPFYRELAAPLALMSSA